MLLCGLVICSFLLLSGIPWMNPSSFSSICIFWLLPPFGSVNNAAVNICVQVVGHTFFSWVDRSGIPWSSVIYLTL